MAAELGQVLLAPACGACFRPRLRLWQLSLGAAGLRRVTRCPAGSSCLGVPSRRPACSASEGEASARRRAGRFWQGVAREGNPRDGASHTNRRQARSYTGVLPVCSPRSSVIHSRKSRLKPVLRTGSSPCDLPVYGFGAELRWASPSMASWTRSGRVSSHFMPVPRREAGVRFPDLLLSLW
jgi:hypothetical protein